jgi:hypothetical protein
VAAKASGKIDPDRTPDRLAAGLAFAFIVLLLATERSSHCLMRRTARPMLPGSIPSIGHSSLPCSCSESLRPYCWAAMRGGYVQSTDLLPVQAC